MKFQSQAILAFCSLLSAPPAFCLLPAAFCLLPAACCLLRSHQQQTDFVFFSIGGGNGVASVPSSPYLFSISKEGILAAILIDFLSEIELILHREVIHLKASLAM